ncbi:MAG TPA: DUF2231 domain-containing protein [Bacteroidales bacterium]|nr:DUF2231 domain-containing protein [Bacteroidales bacterium]
MFNTAHLHPMLVHFPIALVLAGFTADVAAAFFKKEVCLSKAGFYLLACGTLAAAITWLSGAIFTSEMDGDAGAMRETHELFATVTTILLVITLSARVIMKIRKTERPALNWLVFALYGLSAVSVAITGFYGGTLVYNYLM